MITFTFLGVIFSGIVLVLVVYRIDYLERRIKKLENEWSCNRIQQLVEMFLDEAISNHCAKKVYIGGVDEPSDTKE